MTLMGLEAGQVTRKIVKANLENSETRCSVKKDQHLANWSHTQENKNPLGGFFLSLKTIYHNHGIKTT